jgi:hypothetical protein
MKSLFLDYDPKKVIGVMLIVGASLVVCGAFAEVLFPHLLPEGWIWLLFQFTGLVILMVICWSFCVRGFEMIKTRTETVKNITWRESPQAVISVQCPLLFLSLLKQACHHSNYRRHRGLRLSYSETISGEGVTVTFYKHGEPHISGKESVLRQRTAVFLSQRGRSAGKITNTVRP